MLFQVRLKRNSLDDFVPDSAFDIVCCLLGRVWNRPFVLVLSFVWRAVEQRRSSLQILLIIFAHALFDMLKEKRDSKRTKN